MARSSRSKEAPRASQGRVKKPATRKTMPSAPILAPGGNVKGIGKKGQYLGGLNPLVTDPKYGNRANIGIIKGL